MIIKQSNDSEFKNTRIGRIPQDWELLKIEDVALKVTDGTHDTPKPTEKGVPYITAIHVKDGHINFDACYYVSEEVHEHIYKRCNPEKDDLLIVNIGAGTATPARVKVDYQFSMKNVALIKPNPSKLNGAYLEAYQLFVKKKLFRRLTSGGAQPFLSLKEIKKLDIVVPKLVEQQKIASILSTWDKAIELKEKLIEQKKEQKKGIMQKLLTGEVRLPGFDGEWQEVRLGNLTKLQGGYAFKSAEFVQQGIPIIRISNIDPEIKETNQDFVYYDEIGISDSFKVNFGDILIAMSGATTGKVGLYKKREIAYLNQRVGKFVNLDKSKLDYSFLYHLIMSSMFKLQLKEELATGAQPNISSRQIENFKFKIPSLDEQKKISKTLNQIDRSINLQEKEIVYLKQQKQGLMQLLLTGKVRVKV